MQAITPVPYPFELRYEDFVLTDLAS